MQLGFSRTSRKVAEHTFRKAGRAQMSRLKQEIEELRKDATSGL